MGAGHSSSSRRNRPSSQQPPPGTSQWDGASGGAVAGAGGVHSVYPPSVVYRQSGPPPYYSGQQGGMPFTPAWRPPFPINYSPAHQAPPYGGASAPQPPGRQPPPAPYPSTPKQEMTQTCTIRNGVNVKKHTLRLEPLEGSTTKFALRFTMDASAPCMVTVFFQGVEDQANGNAISAPGAHPPMSFEKKLLQEYPRPGCQGAILDTALYTEEQLDGRLVGPQHTGPYPIIIRMEAILEKLAGEGRDLRSVAAGGPQQSWVQSQTTYAALGKHEEHREGEAGPGQVPEGQPVLVHHDARAPQLKVLRQKIWVEGVSFELQEIYGMENQHGGPQTNLAGTLVKAEDKGSQEDAEERLCVICLVNERNTTVLPCRHMCMCNECAQELRKQTSKCPICRNNVESLLHIRREPAKRGSPPPVAVQAEAK